MHSGEAIHLHSDLHGLSVKHLLRQLEVEVDNRSALNTPVGHDELLELLLRHRAYWLFVDPLRRALNDCGLHENDNDEVTRMGTNA